MKANKIRAKIVELGMTQGEVSAKIGISPNSLCRKLRGKRDFSLSEIKALCTLLEIDDPNDIFFEAQSRSGSSERPTKGEKEVDMALSIRQERLRKGWTQEYVAKAAGITKAAYRNIETGIRKPSYDVLIKLLDLFEYNDPRKLLGAATPAIAETPGGNRANQEDLQD